MFAHEDVTIDEPYIHPAVFGSFFDTECYIYMAFYMDIMAITVADLPGGAAA